MRNEQSSRAWCDQVRQTAFDLQGCLRNGHLETEWENGCVHPVKARLCCSTSDQRDSKTHFVTFVLFVVPVRACGMSPLPYHYRPNVLPDSQ